MMADPLLTPTDLGCLVGGGGGAPGIKEEPDPTDLVPQNITIRNNPHSITIKNEPLSPPTQTYDEEGVRDQDLLVPKEEGGLDTSSFLCGGASGGESDSADGYSLQRLQHGANQNDYNQRSTPGVIRRTDHVNSHHMHSHSHPYHHQRVHSRNTRTGCSSSSNNNNNRSSSPTTTTTAPKTPSPEPQQPHQQHQQQQQARFLAAVQRGNMSELEHLLDIGDFHVNGFDSEGQTSLHRACQDGRLDIVKLLVRFGADVKLCNRDGWSALHLACWSGNQAIVAYLLHALKTRHN